jgi:hypothetical protein
MNILKAIVSLFTADRCCESCRVSIPDNSYCRLCALCCRHSQTTPCVDHSSLCSASFCLNSTAVLCESRVCTTHCRVRWCAAHGDPNLCRSCSATPCAPNCQSQMCLRCCKARMSPWRRPFLSCQAHQHICAARSLVRRLIPLGACIALNVVILRGATRMEIRNCVVDAALLNTSTFVVAHCASHVAIAMHTLDVDAEYMHSFVRLFVASDRQYPNVQSRCARRAAANHCGARCMAIHLCVTAVAFQSMQVSARTQCAACVART